MKIKRDGKPVVVSLGWDDLEPGHTYMEVGHAGTNDMIFISTSDDKLVDLGDGESYDALDFETGEFVEVETHLVVVREWLGSN